MIVENYIQRNNYGDLGRSHARKVQTISLKNLDNSISLTNIAEADSTDKGVYEMTLAIGDVIVFHVGGVIVGFYHYDQSIQKVVRDGYSFAATVAGVHTFYVNKDSQVFVTEPSTEVVTKATLFQINAAVDYGKAVFVTGDWIGWKIKTDYRLNDEDGIWRGTFDVPVGTHEYKYVVADYDGTGTIDWDGLNISNRTITVS